MNKYQDLADNFVAMLCVCIRCASVKQHWIESGCIKYWFQYSENETRKDAKTPAQFTDEERKKVLTFLEEFRDLCLNPKFIDFFTNRMDYIELPNDEYFNNIKPYWEKFNGNTFILIATYGEKVIKLFDIPQQNGLQPFLNGKYVYSQYYWELTCEWMSNRCMTFIKHFFKYNDLKKHIQYPKMIRNNDGLIIDIKWYKRNIKDLTRFGKKYYGKRTISELKKVSIVGDKNIWGELTFASDGCVLRGDASNICGDVSKISGEIHPKLYGDVSGLVGNITRLTGDATGIKLNIVFVLDKETDISSLLDGENVVEKFKLISNEDNKTLMKVWNCLAHQTIGVLSSERKLFDNPVKNKPPFTVDKWGRHYFKYEKDTLLVFSINPADIMFAKDVNKCSTCFCLNSGNSRWELGMRCLIALDSINPNLGVAFVIKQDSIKKMNQFNGIKFKWYEPELAGFFQYTNEGITPFYKYDRIWKNCKVPIIDIKASDIKPIFGHDGMNIGHNRQKKLAYLETFIKDGYRWYRGEDKSFPLVNNYHDFTMEQATKNGWDEDIKIAREKEQALYEYLKKVKGE